MPDQSFCETDDKQEPASTPSAAKARRRPSTLIPLVLLSLMVVGLTTFAHWPVLSAKALSFDDEQAVVDNDLVQNPSWHSVRRFFSEVWVSSVVRGYYRPLTLTSLMLDWAMGARPDDPRVFHRTSLALHLGSTVLVILLCYQVFRQPVVAAMVGLLFGVHPLTVEPIAWVMERKTVLAAFFAFACLCSYVRYAHSGRWRWFVFAVLLYLLSLLAKPTGTPLPIIMILMDYWPLQRLNRRAIIEKVPFLLLSAIFAVLCCVCEQRVNPLTIPAVASPLHLPLRLCYLIVFYLCKIFLPIHLSSVYMLPDPLSLRNPVVVLAVAGTIVLIAFLAISRRWTPALWVGAMMFWIGLSPTMGFVGYSWVGLSDKYVYLPAVGLLLVLAWLLERIWRGGTDARRAMRRIALVTTVAVVAGLLMCGTRRYLSYWQTSIGFSNYMLALAPNSPDLYNSRAAAYAAMGDYDQAIRDCTKAIELKPNFANTYYNRGFAHSSQRDYDHAIDDYTKAIELKPGFADAYYNRGVAYEAQHRYVLAIRDYTAAIELNPNFPRAYNNRANARTGLDDPDQVLRDYTKAIELKPDYFEAYYNRADACIRMGDFEHAIADYTKAISLKPDYANAYHDRAVAYLSRKEYDKAWADVKTCRQLGQTPNPDLVRKLREATGRTE